jgi:CDGSH-type Zn-finger protein
MDSKGSVYGLEGRTALEYCRCGLSANKPFVMVHRNKFEHMVTEAFAASEN